MAKVKQQIHKNCGGGIVVVKSGKEIMFACNACNTMWSGDRIIYKPKEWRNIKLEEGMEDKRSTKK